MTSRPRTLLAPLVGLLLGLVLVTGCGDGSGSSDSSGSSESASASSSGPDLAADPLCTAIDRFAADVSAMAASGSVEEFSGHFETARQDLAQVRTEASAELGPALDRVERAVQKFGDALTAVGQQGSTRQEVQKLGTSAQQLATAVKDLGTQAKCPS